MNPRVLFSLALAVGAVSARREGSGGGFYNDITDDDDYTEGSGDLILLPDNEETSEESKYDIHFDLKNSQDYDEDLNEYIYSDGDEDYDDDLTLNPDNQDSVLRFETEILENIENVEIKSKPSEKEFVLKTSNILIMVGSAFVSFGVAMISFFMCRRSMEKRREKILSLSSVNTTRIPAASPIVKNYQRVPTDTQEYLQTQDQTSINMARGGDAHTQSDPLIN